VMVMSVVMVMAAMAWSGRVSQVAKASARSMRK
jgi:hypothetical protein